MFRIGPNLRIPWLQAIINALYLVGLGGGIITLIRVYNRTWRKKKPAKPPKRSGRTIR